MAKKKRIGKIRVGMSEKLNNVFGEYTSMEANISLEWDGDIDNFEAEIDELAPRSDAKIKAIMSGVITSAGYDDPWGGKE